MESVLAEFQVDDVSLGAEMRIFSIPMPQLEVVVGPSGATLRELQIKFSVGVALNTENRDAGYTLATVRGSDAIKVEAAKNDIERIIKVGVLLPCDGGGYALGVVAIEDEDGMGRKFC